MPVRSPIYYDRPLERNPVPVHQGFWRLRIGPLPVAYNRVDKETKETDAPYAPPPEVINANIRDFVCPGLSATFSKEGHYNFVVNIPTTEINQYDDVITVNMLADNYYENWWAIHRYMETVQSGQIDAFPILDKTHRIYSFDHKYRNRLMYIPFVEMHAGDDAAQEHMIVRFERCWIAKLGDLSVKIGSIEPITFNLSIKYEIKRIIRLPDPNTMMSAICVTGGSDSYG